MRKIIELLVKITVVASGVTFALLCVALVVVLYQQQAIPVWYSILVLLLIVTMMVYFIRVTIRHFYERVLKEKIQ